MTSASNDTAASSESVHDVVVIGGGPTGENAADYAHKGGLSVALVEADLMGGECSYWACMPSKALLRPVELIEASRALPGAAEAVDGPLDLAAVLKRRDAYTHSWNDESQVEWAEKAGLEVVRGRGRLTGEKVVEVTAADGSVRVLRARHAVVVATGTTASVPPIPGLREAQPWTSRQLTSLTEVPRRVVVVGGGVVACEGSQILHGLGAESVTVVEQGARLLAKNEAFAGDLLAEVFRDRGIDVRLGRRVTEVSRPRPGGEVTVTLDDGATLVADEVLVAAGRTPAVHDLGLDVVGLPGDKSITVDDHLTVAGTDWLYACGDVNGRVLLTHMGKYQGRVCGDVIVARSRGEALDHPRYRATSDHTAVPQVVFTSPQVVAAGLTAESAAAQGIRIATYDVDLATVAGASLLRDDYQGTARLVVDADAGTVVGFTAVGYEIAELVHAATVAIVGSVPLEALWHAVPSYPTVSEVWLRLLEKWRAES